VLFSRICGPAFKSASQSLPGADFQGRNWTSGQLEGINKKMRDAANCIAKIGSRAKRAVAPLCKTLKNQENVSVRTSSAWALMKIGPAALAVRNKCYLRPGKCNEHMMSKAIGN
jgi:hypothetical protein